MTRCSRCGVFVKLSDAHSCPTFPPADERFWEKVKKTEACWLWTASADRFGYGQFWHQKKLRQAHRWAYERFVGPIPAGLTLDHLCRTPACVNPDHLEPVTQGENTLRGDTFQARNARKTHCERGGHPLTGDNLRNNRGHRSCRECANARSRARHAQARLKEKSQ